MPKPFMSTLSARDDAGEYKFYLIHGNPAKRSTCSACNNRVKLYLQYKDQAEVAAWLETKKITPPYKTLVLKELSAVIGVSCGCYAKFHRQIGHIS